MTSLRDQIPLGRLGQRPRPSAERHGLPVRGPRFSNPIDTYRDRVQPFVRWCVKIPNKKASEIMSKTMTFEPFDFKLRCRIEELMKRNGETDFGPKTVEDIRQEFEFMQEICDGADIRFCNDLQKQYAAYQLWKGEQRPFYNIWPRVAEALLKTRLGFSARELGLQKCAIAICFATNHPLVTTHDTSASDKKHISKFSHTAFLFVNDGENLHYFAGDGIDGSPFGETVSVDEKLDTTIGQFDEFVRIAIGVSLLARDSQFAEPILLARDRGKNLTGEALEKALARAKRNGRFGFTIGEQFESSPHIRSPHFGIRWCGEGRKEARLVPVSGSVVNRKRLYPIPTGYMDKADPVLNGGSGEK